MSIKFHEIPLAAKPDRQDRRDKYKSDRYAAGPPLVLPSEAIIPFLPPIKDQGQTSSCTGHSSAWFWEAILTSRGMPYMPLSPVYHWYFARQAEGTQDQDTGVQMRSIMAALNKFGAVPNDSWPLGKPVNLQPPAEVQILGASKLPVYERCATLQDIKYAIAVEKQPVCIGVEVFDFWYSNNVIQTGVIPYITNVSPEGGHALVIAGYSDKNNTLYIANSWSTQYGDKGFIHYPYDYIYNSFFDAWTAAFDTLPVSKLAPQLI